MLRVAAVLLSKYCPHFRLNAVGFFVFHERRVGLAPVSIAERIGETAAERTGVGVGPRPRLAGD